ncbi:unnamed protein product [Ilex paraguariensis]|uniref:Uncharacterized protein n=1 Tax=Ilex paraguariensis TaxID=185542 RepID=A0ABC8RD42_9AQUA
MRLQPRDHLSSSTNKQEPLASRREEPKPLSDEESYKIAKQKAVAEYMQNHYKEQMKNLRERKERHAMCVWDHLAEFCW